MKEVKGALVGGFIIFIFQVLSWTILDFHRPAQQYTPKQDSILSYLDTQFDSSGGYMLPALPKGASKEEREKFQQKYAGKPMIEIKFHKKQESGMVSNMIINYTVDALIVLIFCWLISGYTKNTFGKTFIASIFTGLIIFLHGSYSIDIWYKLFDLEARFTEYMISWGLTGIWLGWWLNRKTVAVHK